MAHSTTREVYTIDTHKLVTVVTDIYLPPVMFEADLQTFLQKSNSYDKVQSGTIDLSKVAAAADVVP